MDTALSSLQMTLFIDLPIVQLQNVFFKSTYRDSSSTIATVLDVQITTKLFESILCISKAIVSYRGRTSGGSVGCLSSRSKVTESPACVI